MPLLFLIDLISFDKSLYRYILSCKIQFVVEFKMFFFLVDQIEKNLNVAPGILSVIIPSLKLERIIFDILNIIIAKSLRNSQNETMYTTRLKKKKDFAVRFTRVNSLNSN